MAKYGEQADNLPFLKEPMHPILHTIPAPVAVVRSFRNASWSPHILPAWNRVQAFSSTCVDTTLLSALVRSVADGSVEITRCKVSVESIRYRCNSSNPSRTWNNSPTSMFTHSSHRVGPIANMNRPLKDGPAASSRSRPNG